MRMRWNLAALADLGPAAGTPSLPLALILDCVRKPLVQIRQQHRNRETCPSSAGQRHGIARRALVPCVILARGSGSELGGHLLGGLRSSTTITSRSPLKIPAQDRVDRGADDLFLPIEGRNNKEEQRHLGEPSIPYSGVTLRAGRASVRIVIPL